MTSIRKGNLEIEKLMEKPDDVWFGVMTVTPEIAQEMLVYNTKNFRGVAAKKAAVFASHMLAGNWGLNYAGNLWFAKYKKGYLLIDGQTRLHAIIRAGIPVKLMVVVTKGMAGGDTRGIDAGQNRTLAQYFRDLGYPDACASIAKQLNMFISLGTGNPIYALTQYTGEELLTRHLGAILFVSEFAGGKGAGVVGPLRAALAIAWYYYPEERVKEFYRQYINMSCDNVDTDKAAIVLKQHYLLNTDLYGSGGAKPSIKFYRFCERHVAAFCEYESLHKATSANCIGKYMSVEGLAGEKLYELEAEVA